MPRRLTKSELYQRKLAASPSIKIKLGRGRKEERKSYKFRPTEENYKFLDAVATREKLSMSGMLNRILFRLRRHPEQAALFLDEL